MYKKFEFFSHNSISLIFILSSFMIEERLLKISYKLVIKLFLKNREHFKFQNLHKKAILRKLTFKNFKN